MPGRPAIVLFVSDFAALLRFYQAVSDLGSNHAEPGLAVLPIGELDLVIHALPDEPEPERDSAGAVRPREAYLKLCVPVSDLERARQATIAHGGTIDADWFEWSGRGFVACEAIDPEGNRFQLRQAFSS